MNYIKALFMALGMFSVLPAPKNSWDEKLSSLVIPSLPLVGGVVGGLWYGLSLLLDIFELPVLLHAAVFLLIPFLLTGFLHVDGYMDTADAVFSRRPLEERRRILKDSNVGAFAVIALVCLMMLQLAGAHSIVSRPGVPSAIVFIPVLSRCVAGAALLCLRQMYETGYMATFKANSKPSHMVFTVIIAAMTLAAAFLSGGIISLAACAVTLATSGIVTVWVYRQMDGLNGDLCGCIITAGELGGLLFLAIFC